MTIRDVEATQFLTGHSLRSSPHLYLWGRRIDDPDLRHETYEPLCRVRTKLEQDIRTFVTEPDIMLVAPQELVVCIEAKFGSGNPLAHASAVKEGQKPTSRAELLARYLGDQTSSRTKEIVDSEKIGPAIRSQLFRNIVFASEMAGRTPWHVVNLVSSTQWSGETRNNHQSYQDPTDEVRGYLQSDCFTFRTWEGLYNAVISGDPDLARLEQYLQTKSAHFKPAFNVGTRR